MALFLFVISTNAIAEGAVSQGNMPDGRQSVFVIVNASTSANAQIQAIEYCRSNGAYNCFAVKTFRKTCVTAFKNNTANAVAYITDNDLLEARRLCRSHGHQCVFGSKKCDDIDENVLMKEQEERERLERIRQIQQVQKEAGDDERKFRNQQALNDQATDAIKQRDEAIARAQEAEIKLRELQEAHWLTPIYGRIETVRLFLLPTYQHAKEHINLIMAAAAGAVFTALIAFFGVGRKAAESRRPPIEDAISDPPIQRPEPMLLPVVQTPQPLQATGVPGSLMQASLRHERSFNSSYVVLTLKFSREAHQLIRARGIEHLTVLSGELTRPPPGAAEVFGMDWLFRICGFVGAFGIIPCIIYGAAGGAAAGPLLFLCFVLLAVRFIGPRVVVNSWAAKEYTIKSFLRQPTVRLYADNPVFAKGLMDQIKEKIAGLRALLEDSKELPAEETFEL